MNLEMRKLRLKIASVLRVHISGESCELNDPNALQDGHTRRTKSGIISSPDRELFSAIPFHQPEMLSPFSALAASYVRHSDLLSFRT